MKKVFGIIALSMALFACGGNKNEETTDTTATVVEEVVTPTLQMGEWKAGEVSLTLNEDASFIFVEGEKKTEGTYAFNAETKELTLTPTEGEPMVLNLTEAGLEPAVKEEGAAPVVFVAPAPVVEAPAAEEAPAQ
ncbi:MAG: lipocalin-like domain-containing protein [Porphyromonas endodontalis]